MPGKINIKLELKEGSAGNMLVIVKFDPESSTPYGQVFRQ